MSQEQEVYEAEPEGSEFVTVTQENMIGQFVELCVKQLKNVPDEKHWSQLAEATQRMIIQSITQDVANMVHQAVDVMASENRPCIHAKLEKVEIKDGIKGIVTCHRYDNSLHDLVDAQGKAVMLVVSDKSAYSDKHNVKADPDQPEMFDDEEPQEDPPVDDVAELEDMEPDAEEIEEVDA